MSRAAITRISVPRIVKIKMSCENLKPPRPGGQNRESYSMPFRLMTSRLALESALSESTRPRPGPFDSGASVIQYGALAAGDKYP